MIDRTVAPGFSKNFSFHLPQPEIFTLTNGIDLVFLPDVRQEIIKLEVVFSAGKWYEPQNGISHFTASLLDKGTPHQSAKEISEFFDYYGAHVEIISGYDYSSVSLYSLSKNLSKVFQLFGSILTSPTFPENELELHKKLSIQDLKVNNKKNSFVASRLLRKNIFGKDHPYGTSLEEHDVTAITIDQIRLFYRAKYSPTAIYLLGNIARPELKELIDYFSKLPVVKLSEKHIELNPFKENIHQPMPDSVQTSIRFGRTTINRLHPDFPSLLLLNHLLGGYFGSRLMKNIREEKGLTYGIYSSVQPLKQHCMMTIGADVNSEALLIITEEINKELNKLISHPVSEKELQVSKNHFLGNLQLEVSNPFSVMEKIKILKLYQLNSAFYYNLIQSVDSIDNKTLQACAANYLHSFQTVSVG